MEEKISTIRVEEAITYCNEVVKKPLTKRELAAICWPDGNYKAQEINMRSLVNGKTKRVEPGLLRTISKATGVTADFLVGLTDIPNPICTPNENE